MKTLINLSGDVKEEANITPNFQCKRETPTEITSWDFNSFYITNTKAAVRVSFDELIKLARLKEPLLNPIDSNPKP